MKNERTPLLTDSTITGKLKKPQFHHAASIVNCRRLGYRLDGIRTYIPEHDSVYERRWTNKPPDYEAAYRANRRRVPGDRSQRLQKKRSELVERSFAHLCETGGARRTWLRGLAKVNQRYKIVAAAHNLGLIMRKLFGIGKPRCLQGGFAFVYSLQLATTILDGLRRRLVTHVAAEWINRRSASWCGQAV